MKPMVNPQVIAITGASAGLGRAVAREFAKRGASIGLLARGLTGLNATKIEVEKLGGKALVLQTDVSDAKQVDAAAKQIEEAFGPIDIWINNAMVSVFSSISQMEPEEFKRITEVTYLGQVYGTQAALRSMQARDRGTIILVGSALAYRGIPFQSGYCAAKHATLGFFESLRSELIYQKSAIHLTMVQLPAMNTPQFDWEKSRFPNKARPMGAVYQPEVAARVVYWAAHHKRREIYVGWPTVQAIVGNKIAAFFVDIVLGKIGFKGQQRDEPEDPHRPNNLWEPVQGDFGAHGSFDEIACNTSAQTWMSLHRIELAVSISAILLVICSFFFGFN